VIGTRASSDLFGDQKNGLQLLWEGAVGLVRPQGPPGARSGLRGPAHLP